MRLPVSLGHKQVDSQVGLEDCLEADDRWEDLRGWKLLMIGLERLKITVVFIWLYLMIGVAIIGKVHEYRSLH